MPLPEESGDSGDRATLTDRASLVDPRDALDARETAIEITAALQELPPDQRTAIVLVDLEGWSVEEAAKIMDCPAGTVKSRCSRGRAKLARRLQHLRNPDGHETVTPANGGERNGA